MKHPITEITISGIQDSDCPNDWPLYNVDQWDLESIGLNETTDVDEFFDAALVFLKRTESNLDFEFAKLYQSFTT